MTNLSTELIVEGMACDHCRNSVQRLLDETPGVVFSEVHLTTGKVAVTFQQDETSRETLIEKINQTDLYKAS